ncbi:MAG: 3-oxoacyl-[acyl-carrier-protein] reductase [Alphaproteobacteria bacterium]|nr:3-oxoacyl-[acyl-carrier-protein] reductase [Alphaproteobacteria bacterium]
MFDLTGKKALVTGASGAIGGAIARSLVAAGAKVALSGTRVEALQTVAQELGGGTTVVAGDLGDPSATATLVDKASEALGGFDILVNNAGLTRDTLALRMKDEDWQRVLDVNLTAAFRLSRAALRGMIRQRWGRIVNITSIVGVTGNPGQANYAASKAGLIGMSKSLAAEVAARGITINCLAPGFIESPMTAALNDEQRKRLSDSIPAARLGVPSDIGPVVVFLASNEASYITGQTIHVNGGMAMF